MIIQCFVIVWISILNHVVASNLAVESINAFATRIDKILTHNKDRSSVICPFNLHLGLSLLGQGAGGDTAAELASLLGLRGGTEEIASPYKTLLDNLTGESFKTWTCMIPGEDFELKQDFIDTAYRQFRAGAAGASQPGPQNDVTLKYCNNIGSRPKTTKLQIFCKAGFNSSWKKAFPPSEEDDYFVTMRDRVRMMMMTLNDVFRYKEDTKIGAKIINLDYKEAGWSMLLVLPLDSKAALSSLQSKIAESPLTNLIKDLKEVKLEVSIPKFNANAFNFHRDIKFLNKMGANKLFSDEADFSNLSTGGGMHLSHVLVEAFIAVNETSTLTGSGADFLAGGGDGILQKTKPPPKAPSPTTPSMATDPLPTTSASPTPSFKANRPFLFYIVGPGDVFLYSGKIVNPKNKMI